MTSNIDKELENRLVDFFKEKNPSQIAKIIRQSNNILALSFIRQNDATNFIEPKKADDCFYWLNELAEALEPNL